MRTNLQRHNCVLEELLWSPSEDAGQGPLDQCVAAQYPLTQTLEPGSNLHNTTQHCASEPRRNKQFRGNFLQQTKSSVFWDIRITPCSLLRGNGLLGRT